MTSQSEVIRCFWILGRKEILLFGIDLSNQLIHTALILFRPNIPINFIGSAFIGPKEPNLFLAEHSHLLLVQCFLLVLNFYFLFVWAFRSVTSLKTNWQRSSKSTGKSTKAHNWVNVLNLIASAWFAVLDLASLHVNYRLLRIMSRYFQVLLDLELDLVSYSLNSLRIHSAIPFYLILLLRNRKMGSRFVISKSLCCSCDLFKLELFFLVVDLDRLLYK